MPSSYARPWHLVPVGILALLVYGAGALDYLLTQLSVDAYTSRLPGTWGAWVAGLPAWITALWAVAVWGGVLGAVLVLMRERGAVLIFAFAFLAGLAAVLALLFWVSPGLAEAAGMEGAAVAAGGVALLFLLWLYTRIQKLRGALH